MSTDVEIRRDVLREAAIEGVTGAFRDRLLDLCAPDAPEGDRRTWWSELVEAAQMFESLSGDGIPTGFESRDDVVDSAFTFEKNVEYYLDLLVPRPVRTTLAVAS
jgi:hypothetical protein